LLRKVVELISFHVREFDSFPRLGEAGPMRLCEWGPERT
jgi:hypothetical protein